MENQTGTSKKTIGEGVRKYSRSLENRGQGRLSYLADFHLYIVIDIYSR